MDRRLVLANALLAAGALMLPATAATAADASTTSWTADSLEAFADTIIPGAKRYAGDVVVAGASSGPGGVHAGFYALLTDQRTSAAILAPGAATLLNAHSTTYAVRHGVVLSPFHPAFVGLPFSHRTALVGERFQHGQADRDLWIVLALVVSLAFDAAAHLPTAQAVVSGHPGLTFLRFPAPGPDGLWRYPVASYGRVLATSHPDTTATGNPA